MEKVCLNLNLRMFLKVQGGLKVKIEIDFQRFTQQSMYTIQMKKMYLVFFRNKLRVSRSEF